jgi:hypothetical protein
LPTAQLDLSPNYHRKHPMCPAEVLYIELKIGNMDECSPLASVSRP